MADNSIIIQLDLETGETKSAFSNIEKQAKLSGEISGKNFSDGFQSKLNTLLRAASKVAAIGATIASALTLKESITSAIKQEEAINQLNTSLALAGSYSKKASNDVQEFASNLQKVTTIGDESAIALFGFARNLTKTNEQAKQLTSAAIQLSAATGMSLDSSVKNLGKTFGGLTGELGESLPAVKQFSQEQLKAGAALDYVLNRFGGAAEGKVNTFAGAIKQLSNAFGDSLEQQGFFITKSPLVIKSIQALTSYFSKSTDSIKKFREDTGDIFKPIAQGLISIAGFVNDYLIRPFEIAFNVVSGIFKSLFGTLDSSEGSLRGFATSFNKTFSDIYNSISGYISKVVPVISEYFDMAFDYVSGQVEEFSGKFIETLGRGIEFIKPFVSTITGFLGGVFSSTSSSFDGIINKIISKFTSLITTISPILSKFGIDVNGITDTLKNGFNSIVPEGATFEEKFANIAEKFSGFRDIASEKIASLKQIVSDAVKGGFDTPLTESLSARLSEISSFVDNASIKTQEFKNNTKAGFDGMSDAAKQMAKSLNTTINQGIINVVGVGMERLGAQLIKGKKAWENWEKQVASIIGDLAINLGKALIAKGLAIEALGKSLATLSGGAAIAAGLGLIALGGALKAGAGVGASEVTTGSPNTSSIDNTREELTSPENIERQAPSTNVEVVVQGSLVQQEELGTFIAETLSESFGKQGVSLTDARLA